MNAVWLSYIRSIVNHNYNYKLYWIYHDISLDVFQDEEIQWLRLPITTHYNQIYMVQPWTSASSSHASDSGSRCRKRLMRRGLDSIGMTFKLRPVED